MIAGNWKMFKTCTEAVEAAGQLAKLTSDVTETDIMIAPTYTSLALVSEKVKGSNVNIGAQNLFWESQGAYTGEISAEMIVSTGCSHVIIGHSERRQYFGETDESVNKKINAAIKAKLVPVMCIGETGSERDKDQTFSVLDKQIKMGLEGFLSEDLKYLIIAYEPVWAIGTGKTATSGQAQEVHHFLRSLLKKNFGKNLAGSIRILYGGSVKPDNIAELMSMPDIDGALVGGASLDPETFSKIVHF
jgi:triosephosphate isomerase